MTKKYLLDCGMLFLIFLSLIINYWNEIKIKIRKMSRKIKWKILKILIKIFFWIDREIKQIEKTLIVRKIR